MKVKALYDIGYTNSILKGKIYQLEGFDHNNRKFFIFNGNGDLKGYDQCAFELVNTSQEVSIDIQKKVADEVLDKLFLIDPYCIVAGGAVRDWYFNKSASDIDVFFHVREGITFSVIERMIKKAGLNVVRIRTDVSIPEWYKKNQAIKAVMDMEIDGVMVQLVLLRTPTWKSAVPHFPLSICKAWYKNGVSHYEEEFKISVMYDTIFLTSELYNNGDAYIKKIKGKFPDMKFYHDKEKLFKDIVLGKVKQVVEFK